MISAFVCVQLGVIAGTSCCGQFAKLKLANIDFLLIRKIYSTQSFVNLQYSDFVFFKLVFEVLGNDLKYVSNPTIVSFFSLQWDFEWKDDDIKQIDLTMDEVTKLLEEEDRLRDTELGIKHNKNKEEKLSNTKDTVLWFDDDDFDDTLSLSSSIR